MDLQLCLNGWKEENINSFQDYPKKKKTEVDSDLAQYKSIPLHAARCSYKETAF